MKSKHFLTLMSFFIILIQIKAQININPDPNGEPWIVGEAFVRSPEMQAKIDAIPQLILSSASDNTMSLEL